MCLGVSDIPWATIPYDIDQFIQLYALPGDDHPNSLDQYLFPKQPGWGCKAGNFFSVMADTSEALEKVLWSKSCPNKRQVQTHLMGRFQSKQISAQKFIFFCKEKRISLPFIIAWHFCPLSLLGQRSVSRTVTGAFGESRHQPVFLSLSQ